MDLGSVTSFKRQASSLTAGEGYCRINLERNIMDTTQLKRIADALEEILRLVKEDQEKMRKIKEDNDFLDKQSNAEYHDLK